VRYHAHDEML